MDAEPVEAAPRATLGESPRWIGDELHWVDIAVGAVHRWRPGDPAVRSRFYDDAATLRTYYVDVDSRDRRVDVLDLATGRREVFAEIDTSPLLPRATTAPRGRALSSTACSSASRPAGRGTLRSHSPDEDRRHREARERYEHV